MKFLPEGDAMRFWALAAFFALGLTARAADDKDTTWIADYGKARAAARAAGKPIFLVFRCER
jgi:hypothetical protein